METWSDQLIRARVVVKTATGGTEWTDDPDINFWHRMRARISHTTTKAKRFSKAFADPLRKAMKAAGVTPEEMGAWTYMKHIKERNAAIYERNYTKVRELLVRQRDKLSGKARAAKQAEIDKLDADEKAGEFSHGAGVTDEAIQEIKDKLATKAAILERLHTKYYLPIQRERIRIMVEGGLISRETARILQEKMPNYVGLRDLEEGNDLIDTLLGRTPEKRIKRAGARKAFVPALGRYTPVDVEQIIPMTVADTIELISKAEKAQVEQRLLRFANKFKNLKSVEGTPLFTIVKGKRTRYFDPATGAVRTRTETRLKLENGYLPVRLDGEQWYVRIEDERLRDAFATMDAHDASTLLKYLGWASRTFAGFQTRWNVLFPLTNLPRDAGTAFINLFRRQIEGVDLTPIKSKHRTFAKYVGSWVLAKDSAKWKSWLKRYEDAGGEIGIFSESRPEDQIKKFRREMATVKDPVAYASKFWHRLGDVIEAWNSRFELASRVSVFRMLVEAGISPEQAGHVARTITVDFNNRGRAGQTFLKAYAFANANLVGAEQFMRAHLEGNPKVLAFSGGAMAAGFAYAMMMETMLGADPDEPDKRAWDQIPWDSKERFILIPNGKGGFVRIPLPYGFNMPWVIGLLAYDIGRGRMNGFDAAFKLAATLLGPFNPVGNVGTKSRWTDTVVTALTPTVLRPVYETYLNEDWRGQPIYPEPFIKKSYEQARSSQYWKSSEGTLVQQATEWLNQIGGGTKMAPGDRFGGLSKQMDVNPEKLSYIVESFFGGTGRNLLKIYDLGSKYATGTERNYWDYPIVPTFYQERPTWILNQHFNDYVGELEKRHDEYNALKKDDPTEAASYQRLWGPYLRLYPQIRKYREMLKKARTDEQKRRIRARFVQLYARAQQQIGGD